MSNMASVYSLGSHLGIQMTSSLQYDVYCVVTNTLILNNAVLISCNPNHSHFECYQSSFDFGWEN